jgi:hypothetical protein
VLDRIGEAGIEPPTSSRQFYSKSLPNVAVEWEGAETVAYVGGAKKMEWRIPPL